MATQDTTAQLTLIELANRIAPNGDLASIAEVLTATNDILLDAVWLEANGTFNHQYTRRITLPTGQWRQLNAGVTTESSQTLPVTEVMGFLEAYSEADKKLVDNAPKPKEFRMGEARAFLEGMSQTLATALIYADSAVDPEKITGLAPRLDALGDNVYDGGYTGSTTTSIYCVQWGEGMTHLFYPRGSKTLGIVHDDLGEVTLGDATNGYYQGYRDHFEVNVGMAVKDQRCIARLANCSSTGTFDEDLLIELVNDLPYNGKGAVLYANRKLYTRMMIKLKDKTNVNFTPGEGLSGVPIVKFLNIPVRRVDEILLTETYLT